MTKFNIKGKGQVDLGKRDFLAQGGEGAIYVKGKTAYKIYCDDQGNPNPAKMIDPQKIQELACLTDSRIIKPEDLIFYKNTAIGYTMPFVKDTHPLCQLFTKSFKTRNNLTPEDMMELVQRLQEIVAHAHKKGILIVDLNEMNFLADKKFKDIFAIDVDSWQTPHFPATAIMESIRDHQVKGTNFTEGSDWFSFACVSFQMLIGVHPYKGKHPNIKDWTDRMKAGVSVFNKDVSVPKICMPFDVIPVAYRNWYKAVLEDGKRLSPPTDPNELIVVFTPTIKKVSGSNNFDIEDLYEYANAIKHAAFGPTKCMAVVGDEIFVGKRKVCESKADIHQLVFTPDSARPIIAWIEDGSLKLYNADAKSEINFSANAQHAMVSGGRLYIKNVTQLQEIQFKEIGTGVYAVPKVVGNLMEKASKLFDGVAMQNIMGKFYANICPESGVCYQPHLRELDKQRIIDAKYMNNVLMVVTEKTGKYNRYVFRFDETFAGYDVREIRDIHYVGLNFVVNQRGICVCINEDENIEIFTNRKDSQGVKVVDDNTINGDMKLMTDGLKIYFAKDQKIYKFSMK